jgi:glycosyltransferase involved in cell wall biosynthesis
VGGAEKLWWGLLQALNCRAGVEADLIKLPSPEHSLSALVRSYRAFFELDLSGFEMVISTKYPAWMIEHPRHVVYLQHRLRGLYDTYALTGLSVAYPGAFRSGGRFARLRILLEGAPSRRTAPALFGELEQLLDQPCAEVESVLAFPGPVSRGIVHWLDAVGLGSGGICGFAAVSRNVANREGYFPPDAGVRVIHHPSDVDTRKGPASGTSDRNGALSAEATAFVHRVAAPSPGTPGVNALASEQQRPYVFAISRLDAPKRIDLLIKAYRKVRTDFPFLIAGSGPDADRLRELASGDSRIRFLGRVPDGELARWYRECLFVAFAPHDEDYGLITVEAMQAGRAVLTTTDAGGVNEFVVHGKTGMSVVPDEIAVADAMQQMCDRPEHTLAMGEAAQAMVAHVTWTNTVEALLDLAGRIADRPDVRIGQRASGGLRPRSVLLLSPFPVWPARSGGQLRNLHLARILGERMPVHILSLSLDACGLREMPLLPGVRETVIPAAAALREHFEVLHRSLQVDCSDLAFLDSGVLHESFLWQLRREVDAHDHLICSHPYLYPAFRMVTRRAPIYDAHNVESDMKALVLEPAISGECPQRQATALALLKRLRAEEADIYRRACAVSVCSEADLERFNAAYGATNAVLRVVPNGVDTLSLPFVRFEEKRHWQRRTRLSTSGELALFAASWHHPNVEAMAFVSEAAARHPKLAFVVFGSISRHPVCRILPANVRMMGVVSDTEKTVLLRAATLLLNPMRTGSGTNLKMLEYACAGGTIISSPWGNRGLHWLDGEHLLLAECEALAEGVDRALSIDPGQRQRMAGAARRMVEIHYDWRRSVAEFRSYLEERPSGVAAQKKGAETDRAPEDPLTGLKGAGCGTFPATA